MRTYGILDLGLAALYGWAGFSLLPSRSLAFNLALGAVVALLGASGIFQLAGARRARVLAMTSALVLLGFAAVVIFGLVASSAYLRGVYGPLGRGLSVMTTLLAALMVELLALVPLFQLRFHLRNK